MVTCKELAPGVKVETVLAATEATLIIPDNVLEMQLTR